jgi:hypothetical protein
MSALEKLRTIGDIIENHTVKKTVKSDNSSHSYRLPSGAKWEKLTIQFLDGHVVKVSYDGLKSQKFDFKDMGFFDKKSNKPIDSWRMLEDMANSGGRLLNTKWNKKNHRNKKYELNKKLKDFFCMKEGPIPRYTKKDGYCPLFVLLGEK